MRHAHTGGRRKTACFLLCRALLARAPATGPGSASGTDVDYTHGNGRVYIMDVLGVCCLWRGPTWPGERAVTDQGDGALSTDVRVRVNFFNVLRVWPWLWVSPGERSQQIGKIKHDVTIFGAHRRTTLWQVSK